MGGGKRGGRAQPLTAVRVRNAGPGRHHDGGGLGLFLEVDANGSRRWGQRITIHGKRRELGLGGWPIVGLAEAREAAMRNKRMVQSGGDPLAEKRKARAEITFADAVERYLASKLGGMRNVKHRKQWRSTLATYAGPVLGHMPVRAIGTPDVLRVLEPIWASKTETASRLRGRIEAVLSWATVAGYREGDNPARWAGGLKELLPPPGKIAQVENHPAVALGDLAAWWQALGSREGTAALALQFLALTAARSGEVRGATWDEIDLDKAIWRIPAARMKAGRAHSVPLPPEALALLAALPRIEGSPFVFPTLRGGMLSDMSLSAVMRRMQAAEEKAGRPGFLDPQSGRPAVPHGLRSSFRQWAAERGFAREMAEVALSHFIGSDVERAYQRSDMLERRRGLMAEWAATLRGELQAEKVVKLRS